jgi:FtsH-binding integral membrane protein
MILNRLIKNKEKAKRVAHISAGFVILIHAYEKYESGHGSFLFFGIFGIVFLMIAFFHHQLSKKYPWIDAVFFIIEAILSLIVAYEFFHVGKKALPFTYLFLACFQFLMAYRNGKKGIENHTLNS